MRSVEEHLGAALSLVGPGPVETVDVVDCLGRVLGRDVVAAIDLPPWDNSAMDGYAVLVADLLTGPAPDGLVRAVCTDIAAGDGREVRVPPGQVARIMTGAPMPAGADAVIPVEWTDGGVQVVDLGRVPEPGANVRRRGEDVRSGQRVLAAGSRIGPAQVGLAAAVGLGQVAVHRRPRVAVLSTGSELVPPGTPLGRGQIFDSNGPQLAAAVTAAGAEVVRTAHVPDEADAVMRLLDECAEDADLVLTSGGVSAGAYDVVKEALLARGGVEFCQVAMQPGKPQGLGSLGTVPVVTLPGNPVSVFVSFEVFVRPMIRTMLGATQVQRPWVEAVVGSPLRSPAGRRQFVRGKLGSDGPRRTVTVIGGPGSHLLGSLSQSDALISVPADEEHCSAGDVVTVIDLTENGR
ncbi:MAG: molybdopterin molybdotransferase MoeA [Actinobacteria bacterium]|nr:molybdopterin molybdotransferase MoeA [Actinomycetota bacterium]MCG2803037.1 molybdopterin molybdotransferase MoeA [Cellulomonas sp.]